MTEEKRQKLNQLQHLLLEGTVVDAAWLEAKGYPSNLRSYYLRQGWLTSPARGVYTRPGTDLRWESVIFSLQSVMRVNVLVGGRTSLELQGYSHYVRMKGGGDVHLYAEEKLPGWVEKLDLAYKLIKHQTTRLFPNDDLSALFAYFDHSKDDFPKSGPSLTQHIWGPRHQPLFISTVERAVLELLDELPDRESFHNVDMIFQGLANLRPGRLEALLKACKSVKVKRLFLWFAHRHNHAWLKHLDESSVDLGSGKRVLVKGGKLDKRFLITIPEELAPSGETGGA